MSKTVLDWLSQIPEISSNINYQEQIARIHVRVQPLDFDSYRLLNFPKRSFKMETRWKMLLEVEMPSEKHCTYSLAVI
jgi:hypothetical protein